MLPARLPSHLALSLVFGLLAACTTQNKPVEPPRKSEKGQGAAEDSDGQGPGGPNAGGDGSGETASPSQINGAGLPDDKFKEGKIFVNGWDGKSDQPEARKKWALSTLASVPVPTSAGSGSTATATSTATSTATPAANPGATSTAEPTPAQGGLPNAAQPSTTN